MSIHVLNPDRLAIDIISVIATHMREIGDMPFFTTTRLDFLGMDSLDRIEIAVSLEDKYDIALVEDCGEWQTCGDIVKAVCNALEAK